MKIKFLGMKKVCEDRGLSPSATYEDIKTGLWPPGIKSCRGKNSWGEHEVQLMLLAKLRGDGDEEIRELALAIKQQRNRTYRQMCDWYEQQFTQAHESRATQ
jgi:hypothetical protein